MDSFAYQVTNGVSSAIARVYVALFDPYLVAHLADHKEHKHEKDTGTPPNIPTAINIMGPGWYPWEAHSVIFITADAPSFSSWNAWWWGKGSPYYTEIVSWQGVVEIVAN